MLFVHNNEDGRIRTVPVDTKKGTKNAVIRTEGEMVLTIFSLVWLPCASLFGWIGGLAGENTAYRIMLAMVCTFFAVRAISRRYTSHKEYFSKYDKVYRFKDDMSGLAWLAAVWMILELGFGIHEIVFDDHEKYLKIFPIIPGTVLMLWTIVRSKYMVRN